ncbi:Hsp20/alpha crystallin family protein [Noviherbaspirillum pedocola]|uniref:Hsp20/alpha crystallin family protein n=1 Tax=Noviherbaspirillum pedocola TaxID=2801341 RepID=A0A934T3D4_9BURK|nr:Hsp20/alpha crystallin family protein [Noviherbaspirillum pedocola]MBK4739142.1 Hsp20/alpha crystallin family protein [Noviherbaspirillum pedocola]
MFPSMFRGDLVSQMDRLQREMQQAFGLEPDIRGLTRGGFPAMNIGSTPQSIEVYAFIPGIDPNAIDVNLERGVLTVAGERRAEFAGAVEQQNLHVNERFAGSFRKVISLPDDIDPDGVTAQCRDGVLRISIKRRQEMHPRRISIQ